MDFKIKVIAFINLFLRTGIPLAVWIFIKEFKLGISSHSALSLESKIKRRDSRIFSSLTNY